MSVLKADRFEKVPPATCIVTLPPCVAIVARSAAELPEKLRELKAPPPVPALKITSIGPVVERMVGAAPVPAKVRPMLPAASSWKNTGAAPVLRSISTPLSKLMLPGSVPPVPVVMVTLVPLLRAALMSPSWMVEVATGTKGLVGSEPLATPLWMVTL